LFLFEGLRRQENRRKTGVENKEKLVWRINKVQFLGEGHNLWEALKRSRYKLFFLTTVMTVVVAVGSLMYLIEGAKTGFTTVEEILNLRRTSRNHKKILRIGAEYTEKVKINNIW